MIIGAGKRLGDARLFLKIYTRSKSMSPWTSERSTAGLQRADLERRVGELERLVAELLKSHQAYGRRREH
jgi:hypothetical protein